MPGIDPLLTEEDGGHLHQAGLSHTPEDGLHLHRLKLPSGEVLTSMSPAELYEYRRKRIVEGKEYSGMLKDRLMEPMSEDERDPERPLIAFVGAHDSPLDRARGEAMTGPVGAVFNTKYLGPLGVDRDKALLLNVNGDIAAVRKALDERKPAVVVALGKDARDALGEAAHHMLPHPRVLLSRDDTGEVARKMRVIKKRLASVSSREYHTDDSLIVPIAKANDEKRIVYGVVLDPYSIDAHREHVPPHVVEETAHEWLSRSRVIGVEHTQRATAVPVESHLVHYPTTADRDLAFAGQPHRAFQIPYGADIVHSGSWILGTKLGEAEWQAVKDGLINAYSIGGFSFKVPITAEQMPQVEFIDLGG